MKIKVNSNTLEVNGDFYLSSLLKDLKLIEKNGMAVAVNTAVVSRKKWNEFLLSENDEIIIIEAAQGG
jgi:thiamine biosynthesis protein ThiS